MKKRHLFSAMALAAVFAGCSQEELISENNFQDAVDRPEVEAPVITLGTDTRMTTGNSYAKVTWEEGDGFGAMLMDSYDPSKTDWTNRFPIQTYVSSNILYKTEDGKSFFADASLKQGNYLFYAPFNKENFKREPLAVKLPLVQNVVPSADAPSNTAITEFYESGTSPVFVAYDSIWNTPKTELALSMKHIYALPKITLKLGQVQLLDENGKLKADKDGNPIYETSIAIDAIKFTNTTKKIVTAGTIKNQDLINNIGKNEKGEVAWDKAKYENAATADIVKATQDDKAVWVKFNPALTITSTKNGEFFMVLPGAEYKQADLAVEVYTTINDKAYVSAASSTEKNVGTIKPAKNVRLLPGLPYSADEYNADGTMKESKGTSATYTVEGGFIPAETAISGYTEIKSYDELINFIQNVAYRGEPLIEMTKDEAEAIMEKNVIPDPKKYFVITVDEKTPIELDDNFVTVFKNSCVITGMDGAIVFKPNSKRVTLGNITYSTNDPIRFNAGEVEYINEEVKYTEVENPGVKHAVYATGTVIMKGNAERKFGVLTVLEGAEATLPADYESGIRVDNMGGKVTSATDKAVVILRNLMGEAEVTKLGRGSVTSYTNGLANDPNPNDDVKYYATMNVIGANVTVSNTKYGKVNVSGNATVTFAQNDGLVVAGDQIAKIVVTEGSGEVDNTANGKVTDNGTTNKQTVFATISGSNGAAGFAGYDKMSGLTKIVLTGAWNVGSSDASAAIAALFGSDQALEDVNTIDFNAGSSLYLGSGVTLDLSKVTRININADVNWTGRSATGTNASTVELKDEKGTTIVCADKDASNKYKLTETDIDVVKKK